MSAATLRSELTEPIGLRLPGPPGAQLGGRQVTRMDLNGINLVPESQRVVPVGLLAEPVVGTVGWNGAGTSGIEYQYQSLLAGRPGTTDVLESPDGVALPSTDRSTPAQPGTGLELTLDESVQYVTEQALAAEIVASHAVRRNGGDHGREDRRHPGHGQPGLRPPPARAAESPARTTPTLTADVGARPPTRRAPRSSPRPTRCPRASRRRRPTRP